VRTRSEQPDAWAAVADPRRRHILGLLAQQPRSVAALHRAVPVSQPAISQHLKVLREAGLVEFHPAGASRVYHVRPDGLARLRAELDEFWTSALTNFKHLADAESAAEKGPDHDDIG